MTPKEFARHCIEAVKEYEGFDTQDLHINENVRMFAGGCNVVVYSKNGVTVETEIGNLDLVIDQYLNEKYVTERYGIVIRDILGQNLESQCKTQIIYQDKLFLIKEYINDVTNIQNSMCPETLKGYTVNHFSTIITVHSFSFIFKLVGAIEYLKLLNEEDSLYNYQK